MSAISVQLAHLRLMRGLTQRQLAERTGLRRDTISALERGKSQAIEFDTLARLCDALNVGVGDILDLAATSHTAPVLGGEDEEAIIADRLVEAEAGIAALLADPALSGRAISDLVDVSIATLAPVRIARLEAGEVVAVRSDAAAPQPMLRAPEEQS